MSITCDYHLHTSFSEDSDTPMETMVQTAVSLGLKTICFTEHYDLDYPPQYGTFVANLDAYFRELERLQNLYKETIEIRFGLELGMQPHLGECYTKTASEYPFDFLIASQHLVKGGDPYYPEFWAGRTSKAVLEEYFTALLANLKGMKEYDTLGHLDYIVRYGSVENRNYSYEIYADFIDPVLKYLIEQGKCLEVNTAGLKYGLGHPNPKESVLKRYRELGGEQITIGSDGHKPEHIAYAFAQAEAILKELDFRYYTIFRQRKPVNIPL